MNKPSVENEAKLSVNPPILLEEAQACPTNQKSVTQMNMVSSNLSDTNNEKSAKEVQIGNTADKSANDHVSSNVPSQTKTRKWKPPPKKVVKYPVIGANNVAVPTHLFKVILVEDPKLERPLLASFIVPNQPIQDIHLKDFQVQLGALENHVGVRFHQDLDLKNVDDLCVEQGCNMQDYKEFQQFFWSRRLSTPWNPRSLEKDWKEVCKRGLQNEKMENIYKEKKAQFEEIGRAVV
eukprot:TRINITY_DN21725_c0_g1_i1.p1 TRINITY_DN21725_c0_g1~~TRINITY_DN21725_c0_g1_i1.p1  ORF type:complete len:277 (+),score=24.33 TRINITY_DN21725_c0_g1_i1:126-833(+)